MSNIRCAALATMVFGCFVAGTPASDADFATADSERGCNLSAASVSKMRSGSEELRSTSGDPNLDMVIQREVDLIALGFLVQPRLYLFDDSASPNAVATSHAQDPRYPDGTVLFGLTMFQQTMDESDTGAGFAIPGIMAHEFAHILQYKNGGDLPTKLAELQADYLAGWYMGNRQNFIQTRAEEAFEKFFNLGDFAFNSPDHHGTPEERLAAVKEGFAHHRVRIETAYRESYEYVTNLYGKEISSDDEDSEDE